MTSALQADSVENKNEHEDHAGHGGHEEHPDHRMFGLATFLVACLWGVPVCSSVRLSPPRPQSVHALICRPYLHPALNFNLLYLV